MRDDARRKRQHEIEAAAYRLIDQKGFDGMSMLAVARAARASNETLYNWYGDKLGLFRAMVETNADLIKADLETVAAVAGDPLDALAALQRRLIAILTGPRAVALNRAAAADPSGMLGRAIAARGRDQVAPLIGAVVARAIAEGAIAAPSAAEATEWFLALTIGDLQVRRVIGALPALDDADIERRAASAWAAFMKLCAPAG